MNIAAKIITAFLSILLTAGAANAAKFEELPLDAVIAQVLMPAMDYNEFAKYNAYVKEGLIGGVLLQWGSYSITETRKLTDDLQKTARTSKHKTPLFFSVDYEGGTVPAPYTLGLAPLPTNMMVSAAQSTMDCAKLYYLSGLEISKAGIHINFSPVLDVNTNPRNPIIGIRSFGDDPRVVSKMGDAVIEGLHAAKVMAIAKHFPGHGATSTDSHNEVPYINLSKVDLRNVHLVPFESAIKAGVDGIMTTHTVFESLDEANQATFSKPILTDLLKGKMNFKGLIFSDSLDMKGATKNLTIAKAAVKALSAGCDVLLIGKGDVKKAHAEIKAAVISGSLNKEIIYAAAKKVFEAKKKAGLFTETAPEKPADTTEFYNKVTGSISKNAITLLRDKNKLLPLKKTEELSKLCIVFFSPSRFAQDLLPFNTAFYQDGWDVSYYNSKVTPTKTDIAAINSCVKNSNAAILGTFQWAGLTNKAQAAMVKGLLTLPKPIIIVSLMSPYDALSYPKAGTMLATYGINKFSMEGLAEVITGKASAKGSLPVLF